MTYTSFSLIHKKGTIEGKKYQEIAIRTHTRGKNKGKGNTA